MDTFVELANYTIFQEVLLPEEITTYMTYLNNTISMEKSSKFYINASADYLQSCNDLDRNWKLSASLKIYLINLHEEDVFCPTTLWSLQSAIAALFICILNIQPKDDDLTIGAMLKNWAKKYESKKANTHDLVTIKHWLKDAAEPSWKKPCYVIQLCCLGRKIEIVYMQFSDVGNNIVYVILLHELCKIKY